MTSIFQIDAHNDVWRMLPGGVYILQQHHYSAAEQRGVMAVSIASIISIVAILGLLFAIAVSLLRNWPNDDNDSKRTTRHAFIKSHAGIYFICMLLTTLTFTIGWMLSIVWAVEGKITFGTSCTVQAALKQFGNVSTALWVLAIAIHTFIVVFLQLRVPNWVFAIVLGMVWLLSAGITIAGPLFFTTEAMGPWYGISAQWCWTSDSYVIPRFVTEYFWMFLSAGLSFILYTLLFLKLRGHFSSNFKFSLKARPVGSKEYTRVAHQMLWYPVIYTILVFPIVGCRIYEFKTFMHANLDLKMASAVLFMLLGLANVVLYTITRNIFPIPSFFRKMLDRDSEHDGFRRVESAQGSPSIPVFAESKTSTSSDRTTGSSLPGGSPTWKPRTSSSSAGSDMSGLGKQVEIASPTRSYQPAGSPPKGGALSKSSSLLSSKSGISTSGLQRNGSAGSGSLQRNGSAGSGRTRAVIRKPQPAAMAI